MKEKKRGLKREGRKGVEKREGKKGRAWREGRRILLQRKNYGKVMILTPGFLHRFHNLEQGRKM